MSCSEPPGKLRGTGSEMTWKKILRRWLCSGGLGSPGGSAGAGGVVGAPSRQPGGLLSCALVAVHPLAGGTLGSCGGARGGGLHSGIRLEGGRRALSGPLASLICGLPAALAMCDMLPGWAGAAHVREEAPDEVPGRPPDTTRTSPNVGPNLPELRTSWNSRSLVFSCRMCHMLTGCDWGIR